MNPSATQRLAIGLAAAAVAYVIQLAYFVATVGVVPADVAAIQLVLLLVLHATLALVLGNRGDQRPWAAAAVALPVAAAVTPLIAVWGTLALVGLWGAMAALVTIAGFLRRLGPGAPLLATALGAMLAADVALSLASGPRDAGNLARLGIVTVATGLLLLGSGRVPQKIRLPAPWTALGVAVVGATALFVATDSAEEIPPSPPDRHATGPPPVVLVVADTLRADHLRLYGYERDTMPRLERFAREHCVVVQRATTTSSWSLPTHASLFTGLYPPRHGAHRGFDGDEVPRRFPLPDDIPTLAGLLADAGYWTVGISANFGALSPKFGLARGFDHYEAVASRVERLRERTPFRPPEPGEGWRSRLLEGLDDLASFRGSEFFAGVPYRRAAEITDRALQVIDAAGDRPFFLFLNYFDPHDPYRPPRAFREAFPGRSAELGLWSPRSNMRGPRERAVLRAHRPLADEERAHLKALYDGELAYLDVELGRLLDALERHPRFGEMLVVVTSDHGEAFGEHGHLGHGISLFDEIVGVPLIVKPGPQPGLRPGSTLSGPVQSVDVFATALEHASVASPQAVDGLPWGRGRQHSAAWLFPKSALVGLAPELFGRELRSLEQGSWKLVLGSDGRAELYDLAHDPAEQQNRTDQEGSPFAKLLAQAEALPESVRRYEEHPEELSEEALDALRALGYAQ
jgi:arylsulfatase A-like enzyme